MNILLLYTQQLLPFEQSWYKFYDNVLSYLVKNGVIRGYKLLDAYLNPSTDNTESIESEMIEYKSIGLNDTKRFNTKSNQKQLIEYINTNHVDCLINLMFPTSDLSSFIKAIKKNTSCKTINILHNRPDLVIFKRKNDLKAKLRNITSVKVKLEKIFKCIYLPLLDIYIRKRFQNSYSNHDAIAVLSKKYIDCYKSLIRNKWCDNVFGIGNVTPLIKSEISIANKYNEIIFVGSLNSVKSVDRLLGIWSKIQDKINNWSFIIVGDGPDKLKLESIVYEKHLKRVVFIGQTRSIPYIDHAKILCLTSNFEGLPTVFLEAMRLGVVPIGYNTFQAIDDMIDNGKSGYIIPFEDENAYIEAILNLTSDDDLRQTMAKNARIKSEDFNQEKIGKQWLEVFEYLKIIPENKM
jgi:glycosyltransferase involved in cell wall biosynthesis